MSFANALQTETWQPTLAEPSRPCHQWIQALEASPGPHWGISGDQWMSPEQDTYFFCDLHADADAFLRSLKLSGLITRDSALNHLRLTAAGQRSQIIIGGDCFDKGPSNLALLSLIGELYRQHADVILLAGNHDMRIYAGLRALDVMNDWRQAHFFIRMGRKTVPLFAEIHAYGRKHLTDTMPPMTEADIRRALLPPPEWFEFFPAWAQGFMPKSKIDKEIKRIKQKQTDFFQACAEAGLGLRELYQATLWAKDCLLNPEGAFGWFFQSLDLLHISGSYCFSHAGLDDQMAMRLQVQSPDQINQHFRQQLQEGRIFQLYYSALGNTFRTKYRAGDYPLTPRGVRLLKERRIYAMVNGHRSHPNGQQLFVREGLLNFECDTQLNANCRRKKQRQTPGEAVTIFHSDGRVQGLSADYPAVKQFHPNHLSSDDAGGSHGQKEQTV
ncbi:metallophosphoesterase [Thiomicrospira sp. WB1]|uniref:metallophosphoesterase n=1 Tax=Thiomicrospira sp. WB1 TaxID=1685380 RepID=UPI000747E547|nr:metallophosphoesterase [Thiomicrospira sp. WB1]KUJ71745.1 hypothetical protein AVO41_04555 [Thiomicrospira sp. WB1]